MKCLWNSYDLIMMFKLNTTGYKREHLITLIQ